MRLCAICHDNIDDKNRSRLYCDVCIQVPQNDKDILVGGDKDYWANPDDKARAEHYAQEQRRKQNEWINAKRARIKRI